MIVFTSRFFYYDSSVNDQNYREYSRVYDGAYGAGGAGSNLESFVATQNKERKNNARVSLRERDYLMKT